MPRPKKIRSLKDILALAKRRAGNKRLVLAAADPEEGLKCVRDVQQHGLIQPILVGDRQRVTRLCRSLRIPLAGVEIIDEPDPQQAAVKAVAMCREGDADILMKGNVHTDVILRAILDRDSGLGRGGLLSNTAVFESPHERRLMFMADPAVNINPDVDPQGRDDPQRGLGGPPARLCPAQGGRLGAGRRSTSRTCRPRPTPP